MSKENAPDDYVQPDRTVDPNDPEPRFKDIESQTEEEIAAHMAWLKRNFEALSKRGVECWFEDDEAPPESSKPV